jgi:hypothetical protein
MSESEKAQLQDDVIGPYERYSSLQNVMVLMMVIGSIFVVIGVVSLIVVFFNSVKQLSLVNFPTVIVYA